MSWLCCSPARPRAGRANVCPEMHDEAYDELLAATPPGWYVGRPMFHDERNEWQMYAFDPSERPIQGSGAASGRQSARLKSSASTRWPAV